MIIRRALSLTAVCLMLGSCQPPTYDIIAVGNGSDLVFEARGSGSWPFRDDDGISAEWLQVRNRDEIVWAIQLDPDRPDCKPTGAMPPFPLVYGRTPTCYLDKVAVKPIREGALHQIDGEGFRDGYGLFRLQGQAVNFEWSEVEKELQSWPILADPRFPPGRGNGLPLDQADPKITDAAAENAQ
jgi:hypothetical protein